ncbi:MAG: ATP-binding protein [Candidatus Sumerlaeaceae bacterium]|nr:ATP-binding protein [Candidatus Sumerlaeaceae bacterium]
MDSQGQGNHSLTGTRFTFSDIFQGIASAWRFEEMLDCILSVALRELEAHEGSLLLIDGECGTLKMLAARGVPEEIRKRGYVPRAGSISERVITECRPIIVNGTVSSEGFLNGKDNLPPRPIRSAICVPLIAQGRLLGTMNINRTSPDAVEFTGRELKIAEMIASQAAMVIENHRLHEELQHRERLAAIGQVVAGVAHSVKNMLAGVQGGLGLVRMGSSTQNCDLVDKGVAILSRSLTILSNLLLDLLDLSKERQPVKQPCRAAEVLAVLSDMVAPKAENLGIVFEASCNSGDFEFWADRDQLTRALLNLLLNAVEACLEKSYPLDEQPCVRVSARQAEANEYPVTPEQRGQVQGWTVFEVSDNGPGIAPEALPHLWDLFYSTKGSKGTGIGLPAARKVISEHGGKILLETHQGRGTTFTVLLPCLRSDDLQRAS